MVTTGLTIATWGITVLSTYHGVLSQLAEGGEGVPVGPADLLHHQAQLCAQLVGLQHRHLHCRRALLLLVAVIPHRWGEDRKEEGRSETEYGSNGVENI